MSGRSAWSPPPAILHLKKIKYHLIMAILHLPAVLPRLLFPRPRAPGSGPRPSDAGGPGMPADLRSQAPWSTPAASSLAFFVWDAMVVTQVGDGTSKKL